MNKTIKKGLIEMHNFNKYDVPIILYPNVKKYKNVPFLVNKHTDLELLFVQEGKIEVHLDDSVFCATPGNIVVANSNVLHNIIPITESILYECIIIDRNFCNQYNFLIDKYHIQEILYEPELFDRMNRIKNAMLQENCLFRIAEVTAEVLLILTYLFRSYAAPVKDNFGSGSRVMLERGIEYIHEHFQKQIDVDMIADYVGYSKFYFCRKFKEITGCTVNTYINMQRISYAKELFMSGVKSVAEVAVESGFNNATYFSQTFRKYVRCSPGEYKKHIKNRQQE